MRRIYDSPIAWEAAVLKEPWLAGLSLHETKQKLSISEQKLGELLLNGKLSISYVKNEAGEVIRAVVPLLDVQDWMRQNRARFVGPELG